MKVRCNNDSGWHIDVHILWGLFKFKRSGYGPRKGDVVTVVGETWEMGEQYYLLKEWEPDDQNYLAICFDPIDEAAIQEVSFQTIKESNPVCVN